MDEVRAARLEMLMPLLACPTCRGRLGRGGDGLRCGGCDRRYPIIEGRPVFLPGPGEMPKVMPPEKLSNQLEPDVIAMLESLPGWSLNIGAGGTVRPLGRCVELEYSIFRNTDVASDAHALPFANATFDAVVSCATFEHLAEPHRVADEIYRVLKPGGRVFVETAFIQPLHEAPHHYFNATEFGVRRWFAAFESPEIAIPHYFQPANAVAWIACNLLISVDESRGAEARGRIAAMTLGQWAEMWDRPALRGSPEFQLLEDLPDSIKARISAGFQIRATKPLSNPMAQEAVPAPTYRPAFGRLARWWAEATSAR